MERVNQLAQVRKFGPGHRITRKYTEGPLISQSPGSSRANPLFGGTRNMETHI